MVDDFFDGIESFGSGEAVDGHFVDAALASESVASGEFLEFLNEGIKVAFMEDDGD